MDIQITAPHSDHGDQSESDVDSEPIDVENVDSKEEPAHDLSVRSDSSGEDSPNEAKCPDSDSREGIWSPLKCASKSGDKPGIDDAVAKLWSPLRLGASSHVYDKGKGGPYWSLLRSDCYRGSMQSSGTKIGNTSEVNNRPVSEVSHRPYHRESRPIAAPDSRSALKFSIDNILRPEFGQKSESGNGSQEEAQSDTDKSSSDSSQQQSKSSQDKDKDKQVLWPAWVYCTRYSDRPSSGPRIRRIKKTKNPEEKRPRTAFTSEQLERLRRAFQENRYLTEARRRDLARDLSLNEAQIKIWFQNKRAKLKKSTGRREGLAMELMAQGLYNHATVPIQDEEDDKDQDT